MKRVHDGVFPRALLRALHAVIGHPAEVRSSGRIHGEGAYRTRADMQDEHNDVGTWWCPFCEATWEVRE